jgi:hypothetical protein
MVLYRRLGAGIFMMSSAARVGAHKGALPADQWRQGYYQALNEDWANVIKTVNSLSENN